MQAKRLLRDGYTLVEMLVVLSIIIVFLSIVITHPKFDFSHLQCEYEIKKLTSEIDFYQSQAIKHHQSILMLFRKQYNDIKIVTSYPQTTRLLKLNPLNLKTSSNLPYLKFDKKGQISKFGTLYFEYQGQTIALIFHIEQGRYRIKYLK